MAESEGFEPPDGINRQRFSRPPHSTTLPALRGTQFNHIRRSKPSEIGIKGAFCIFFNRSALSSNQQLRFDALENYKTTNKQAL
mgnify:FL=1